MQEKQQEKQTRCIAAVRVEMGFIRCVKTAHGPSPFGLCAEHVNGGPAFLVGKCVDCFEDTHGDFRPTGGRWRCHAHATKEQEQNPPPPAPLPTCRFSVANGGYCGKPANTQRPTQAGPVPLCFQCDDKVAAEIKANKSTFKDTVGQRWPILSLPALTKAEREAALESLAGAHVVDLSKTAGLLALIVGPEVATVPAGSYFSATGRNAPSSLTKPGQPAAGWQPIETAPKDGRAVLVCRARDAEGKPVDFGAEDAPSWMQVAVFWKSNGWTQIISRPLEPSLHFEPSHRMPLPPGPFHPPDSRTGSTAQREQTAPAFLASAPGGDVSPAAAAIMNEERRKFEQVLHVAVFYMRHASGLRESDDDENFSEGWRLVRAATNREEANVERGRRAAPPLSKARPPWPPHACATPSCFGVVATPGEYCERCK